MLPISARSHAVAGSPVIAAPAIDLSQAAEHLAGMLRFKTVWSSEQGPAPSAELKGLRDYIAKTYPLVHQRLKVEQIGESLLYTWMPKTSSAKEPILLMSHMDVVPVEPGTEGKWTHPPFAGVIADGKIYGRGAIDTKGTMCAILESLEGLLAAGGEPSRPVYVALGADEEVLGITGAGRIAKTLEKRGVKVEFAIDEGTPIVEGAKLGISKPAAVIGLGEKGFVSVELTATGPAGHSSIPHANTAIEVLARTIERLQTNQPSPRMTEPVRETLKAIAKEMPFAKRWALLAGKLGEWLFMRELVKNPVTAALVKTVSTPTIINGGVKDNVIPETAKATVNFRTLPGETVESVVDRVKDAIGDNQVSIRLVDNAHPASPISSAVSAGFVAMATAIRAAFGDEVVMVPSLQVGGTDARYFSEVAKDAYRFSPYRLSGEDIGTIHATNEKLSVANLEGAIRFYQVVLTQTAVTLR